MIFPVERTAVEYQAPSHIGREPFAETEIVVHGEVAGAFTLNSDTFYERCGDTGTELDEPIVFLVYVVVSFAGNFGGYDGLFFNYH